MYFNFRIIYIINFNNQIGTDNYCAIILLILWIGKIHTKQLITIIIIFLVIHLQIQNVGLHKKTTWNEHVNYIYADQTNLFGWDIKMHWCNEWLLIKKLYIFIFIFVKYNKFLKMPLIIVFFVDIFIVWFFDTSWLVLEILLLMRQHYLLWLYYLTSEII